MVKASALCKFLSGYLSMDPIILSFPSPLGRSFNSNLLSSLMLLSMLFIPLTCRMTAECIFVYV
jgi:hypothetical protein